MECKFFLAGYCRLGNNCRFIHTTQQYDSKINHQQTALIEEESTSILFTIDHKGDLEQNKLEREVINNDDKKSLKFPNKRLRTQDNNSNTLKKDSLCRFYLRGKCTNENCLFIHSLDEPTSQNTSAKPNLVDNQEELSNPEEKLIKAQSILSKYSNSKRLKDSY